MKAKRRIVADADLNRAGRALERAAARARQVAEETGTPLYVLKAGRIVDLNAQAAGAYVLREGGRPK
jgi:phosphate uptake regulator